MKNLEELEKKYAELGREIEALKSEKNSEHKYPIYCLGKFSEVVVKFTSLKEGVVVQQGKYRNVGITSANCEEHTNSEYWQQLDVCPDTEFYDGQLVWCWDDDDTHRRELRFYDVKNKAAFSYNGKKHKDKWLNYEPFEGNWPEWALEAFKTLER